MSAVRSGKAKRNGTRVRTLYTRVGPVSLQVPQARDSSFSTDIFKRGAADVRTHLLGG